MRERHVYHNVLRAWCDQHDQDRLNGSIGKALASASPNAWLPFTADRYLVEWRDVLASQFHPGANVRTVEVFAERGGVPQEKFREVLAAPEQMERCVFAHAPRERIEKFYRDGYEQMAELVVDYFRTK